VESNVTDIKKNLTDMNQLMEELDASVFKGKIERALSDAALGVTTHGRAGKVVITFDIDPIGDSDQVNLKHKLVYAIPTKRGKSMEEDATSTPMYVGGRGRMTLLREDQGQLFDTQGNPAKEEY
jgi:hypothetical protein